MSLAANAARSFLSRQFLTFLLVGGFAAFVNWLSRYWFSGFMPFNAAIVAAYLVGMATAFALSRLVVFDRSGRTARSDFLRFAIVNLFAVVQVWAISVALARWLLPGAGITWHAEEIAHAVGVAAPIVTSYLGHKYFTFGKSRADTAD